MEQRVALIGFGLVGLGLPRAADRRDAGLELAAVVTGEPGARRPGAKRRYPGVRVEPDPEAVWERAGDYDVVVVATPNDSHVRARAGRAIEAGLAVVVDKPLAPTRRQAPASWSSTPSGAASPLTVFHNRRWDSDQLTLRRLIAGGPAGRGAALRVAVRALAARASRRGVARDAPRPSTAAACCSTSAPTSSTRRWLLFGPVARRLRRGRARRGGAGRRRRVHRARARIGCPQPPLGVLGGAGTRAAACASRGRAAFVVEHLDGQEEALRSGARPGADGRWGVEPEERWGRLIPGDEAEPVPAEPGDWPRFYAGSPTRSPVGGDAGRPPRRGRGARDPRPRPGLSAYGFLRRRVYHAGVHRNDDSAILLTGATGFLGGEVLARLLEHEQRPVYALIRADDRAGRPTPPRPGDRLARPRPRRASGPGGRGRRRRHRAAARARHPQPRRARRAHRPDHPLRRLGLVHARARRIAADQRRRDAGGCSTSPSSARGSAAGSTTFVHVSTAYVAGRHPEPFSERDLDAARSFATPTSSRSSRPSALVAEPRRDASRPGRAAEHRRRRLAEAGGRRRSTSSTGRCGRSRRAPSRRSRRAARRRSTSSRSTSSPTRSSPSPGGRGRPSTSPRARARAASARSSSWRAGTPAEPAARSSTPGIYRRAVHPLLVRTGGERSRRALRRSEVYFPYFDDRSRLRRRAHPSACCAARDRAAAASRLLRPADGLRPGRRLGEARAHPARRRRGARGTGGASATAGGAARDPPRIPAPSQWGR